MKLMAMSPKFYFKVGSIPFIIIVNLISPIHIIIINLIAEGDEQVDEGVEDDDGEELGEANVAGAAVPHAHHIHALDAELADSLLQPGVVKGGE